MLLPHAASLSTLETTDGHRSTREFEANQNFVTKPISNTEAKLFCAQNGLKSDL